MPVARERLETDDVNKLLISLSIPAFLAMIANGIYNIIDTILIGRGVSTLAIGAIAIVFPIQSLYMAFSQLVAIGAAAAISREIGNQNEDRASQIATNAFVITSILSLLLTLLTVLFIEPLLTFFGATSDIIPYAKQYLFILSLGIILNANSLLSNAILRSQSFTKLSTIAILVGIATNLIISPLLVLVFGLGIQGAAIGNVSATLASFLFGFLCITKRHVGISLKRHYLKLQFDIVKQIVSVGISAFARNSSIALCSLIINNTLKLYGDSFTILTFGIVNRLVSFYFLPILGITQGLQPIVGYNYGAKNYARILKVVRFATIYTTSLCLLGTVVSYLFPYQILSLFTDDTVVIESGIQILKLKMMLFSLVGIQMVTSTLFQSLGKAIPSLFLSLLRQFILLLPFVYFIPKLTNLGVLGVFISFPLTDAISFIITLILLWRQLRTFKSLSASAN